MKHRIAIAVAVCLASAGIACASSNLIVSGHTDATGSLEHNFLLSQRRAEAVKAYLVSIHDVAPSRLKAIGRGPNELLDEAHPQSPANRRVQLAVAA